MKCVLYLEYVNSEQHGMDLNSLIQVFHYQMSSSLLRRYFLNVSLKSLKSNPVTVIFDFWHIYSTNKNIVFKFSKKIENKVFLNHIREGTG